MSDSFLPDNYKVPGSSGAYMRLKPGENRFRFLSNPIMGTELWVTLSDGKRSPKRYRMGVAVPVEDLTDDENVPRHFWAMVVYNYETKKIEILEITQSRIQNAITSFYANPKWGDPKEYDLNITKSGEGLKTVYNTMPEPKEKIDAEILKQFKETQINLEALYDGGNPFAGEGALSTDDVDF